ncbi:unnamed protein product [Amoebophrya sp. A120]|nr:unnamed protein product [Amoebophrya sp. A120]|eukprot:GSA120T00006536001.1
MAVSGSQRPPSAAGNATGAPGAAAARASADVANKTKKLQAPQSSASSLRRNNLVPAGTSSDGVPPALEKMQAHITEYDFYDDIVDEGLPKNTKGVSEADAVHDRPANGDEILKLDSANFASETEFLRKKREKEREVRLRELSAEDRARLQKFTDREAELRGLSDFYDTAEAYREDMEPLFLEELKATLARGKAAMISEMEHMTQIEFVKPPPPATGEQPWLRLELDRRSDVYLQLSRKYDESQLRYCTGDIVLLSDQAHAHTRTGVHALCVVHNMHGMRLTLRTIVRRDNDRCKRLAQAVARKSAAFQEREAQGWYVSKVESLSTSGREWIAMHALDEMPLKPYLLNWSQLCSTDPNDEVRMKISHDLENRLRERYNASQLHAIQACRKAKGITLVQGPPGTGKSTTISGIISVLINSMQVKKQHRGDVSTEEEKLPLYLRRRAKQRQQQEEEKFKQQLQLLGGGTNSNYKDKRQIENLLRMRSQQPWMYQETPFVPWMDDEANDVSAGMLIRDYVKLPASCLVSMSAMTEEERPSFSKVLVCAPSNAAIDEIVRRLTTEGIFGRDGKTYKPNVIRLGPGVHDSLQQFSLEHQATLRAKAQGVHQGAQQNQKAELDLIKRQLLLEANVVCATCSVAGARDVSTFGYAFESVVIDEAAQGVELSTLIPLQSGCKRLVLVGDPLQLPATVFSGIAKKKIYDRSLFQRLAEDGYPVERLSVQYRMHPRIAAFPSRHFYQGSLGNFRDEVQFEEHFGDTDFWELPYFKPLSFFNLTFSAEAEEKHSIVNEKEADFVVLLYKTLVQLYPKYDWRKWCGVISPYERQVSLLKRKFRDLYGLQPHEPCPVEVKTVDGFQGSEKEVILLSTVRSNAATRTDPVIGFLRDTRRMNVAMTRARRGLFVVGNAATLQADANWKAFLKFVRNRTIHAAHDINNERALAVRIREFLRGHREWVPTEAQRRAFERELTDLSLSPKERATKQMRLVHQRKRARSGDKFFEAASSAGVDHDRSDDDSSEDDEPDTPKKKSSSKKVVEAGPTPAEYFLRLHVESVPFLRNFEDAAEDARIDPHSVGDPGLFHLTKHDISSLVAKQKEEQRLHQTEAEFARELAELERKQDLERKKAAEEEERQRQHNLQEMEAQQDVLDYMENEDEQAEQEDHAHIPKPATPGPVPLAAPQGSAPQENEKKKAIRVEAGGLAQKGKPDLGTTSGSVPAKAAAAPPPGDEDDEDEDQGVSAMDIYDGNSVYSDENNSMQVDDVG